MNAFLISTMFAITLSFLMLMVFVLFDTWFVEIELKRLEKNEKRRVKQCLCEGDN